MRLFDAIDNEKNYANLIISQTRSMGDGNFENDSNRAMLSPEQITEILNKVKEGEKLILNDRDEVFRVLETDKYSLLVVDNKGNRHTISQNLQTGGWSINEEINWVKADSDSSG